MREFVWSLSALKTLFWIFFFVNDDSLYKFEAKNKGCTVWKKITKNSCSQKKWNQEWAGVKRQQFCLRKQILRRWKFNKRFSGRHYYLKKSCNCLSPECCTNKSQQLPWYSDTTRSWILRKWECLSLKLPNLRKHYILCEVLADLFAFAPAIHCLVSIPFYKLFHQKSQSWRFKSEGSANRRVILVRLTLRFMIGPILTLVSVARHFLGYRTILFDKFLTKMAVYVTLWMFICLHPTY